MFKIWNEHYYIDMDAIEEYSRIEETTPTQKEDESMEDPIEDVTKIHLIKYETVKFMLEILMEHQEDIDEKMGMSTNELSVPFKLAFNSLLMKKIINKL